MDATETVDKEKFHEWNQYHIANHIALYSLLIKKGVITQDEFDRERIKATQAIDQEWARKIEQEKMEFCNG